MGKAKIICLESCDGAGKTTQVKEIIKYLTDKNKKVTHLHFPMYGHNDFSKLIAKFLQGDLGKIDEVNPLFVANIYAMDRYMFLPELKKLMDENDVIVLDRYVFSNIAFQCAKLNDDIEALLLKQWILDFEFDFLKLPYPDLTLFLNIPIEVAMERLEKRKDENREYLEGKQDIHEADINFQIKVRSIYKSLSDLEKYHIINCTEVSGDFGDTHLNVLTPEELFSSYVKLIDIHILNNLS